MANNDSITIPSRAIDLTGQRFGRLLVLRYAGTDKNNAATWRCKCDCGKDHTVESRVLRKGDTQSCGCLPREIKIVRFTTHGMSHLPEYDVWKNMIARCHCSTNSAYHLYGGRGITVCDRWRESFVAFYEDMGLRPSADRSIDRIDNDLGYSMGNCRWATLKEQARNNRNNRLLTFLGKTRPLVVWAEEYGISQTALRGRLKMGWPIGCALIIPVQIRSSRSSSQFGRLG